MLHSRARIWILAALVMAGAAQAQDFAAVPALVGPVVDQAGVLDAGAERAISDLARELEQKTGAEMAVLTVPTTAPEDVFDYGMRVAESWKLGKQGVDNGLLLVVAVDDRKLHMFTGYGLEGILPDGRVGAIRDNYLTPHFRKGDYAAGIYSGLRATAELIAADAGVQLTGEPARPPRERSGRSLRVSPFTLLLLGFFVLPALLGGGRRRRRGFAPIFFGGGGGFGGGGAGGSW
jgi:uncharacterized protein